MILFKNLHWVLALLIIIIAFRILISLEGPKTVNRIQSHIPYEYFLRKNY